jgi:hypothetical protein
MGHRSDTRFLVLHGVRLKGFSEPAAIAAAVGLDEVTVSEHLAKLQIDELVLRRDGRLSGWTLTQAGRVEQQRLATADLAASGALEAIRAAYERFLAMNADFKVLCTDWQVRDGEIYDHADAAYNAGIVARLRAMHEGLVELLRDLTGRVDRYAPYEPRFTAAVERFEAGELDLLTKPLIDSYHTIWFELHEDLLTGLGIDRSQEGSF